ncbi:hypothetical protein K491DRAFT_359185 [Lophiostoma macrostomum CBS 122681]|uniref:Uncharacterized protein n=1 Tax=Lophiostoma macrostomum CBS 122681 TaxID=1314788 RepID=A0A6A6TB09_9PLEO|nr:hypothetical protein K491DRAFT_359185 [Lophiostoma macrostomum CBS 122681]
MNMFLNFPAPLCIRTIQCSANPTLVQQWKTVRCFAANTRSRFRLSVNDYCTWLQSSIQCRHCNTLCEGHYSGQHRLVKSSGSWLLNMRSAMRNSAYDCPFEHMFGSHHASCCDSLTCSTSHASHAVPLLVSLPSRHNPSPPKSPTSRRKLGLGPVRVHPRRFHIPS